MGCTYLISLGNVNQKRTIKSQLKMTRLEMIAASSPTIVHGLKLYTCSPMVATISDMYTSTIFIVWILENAGKNAQLMLSFWIYRCTNWHNAIALGRKRDYLSNNLACEWQWDDEQCCCPEVIYCWLSQREKSDKTKISVPAKWRDLLKISSKKRVQVSVRDAEKTCGNWGKVWA